MKMDVGGKLEIAERKLKEAKRKLTKARNNYSLASDESIELARESCISAFDGLKCIEHGSPINIFLLILTIILVIITIAQFFLWFIPK
jgi:hypothetical protein